MKQYNWAQIRQETHALAKVAVPAIFAQLAQMTLGVIDTLMAGNYSSKALAAVGTGVNVFTVIFSLFLGLLLALNPMISHFNGQGKFEEIGKTFQLGMFLSVIFGIITFILLNSVAPILSAINVEKELVTTTSGYLSALSWGSISIYLFLALRSGNEGLFSTKAVMVCSFLAIPFNVLLNNWFIYGGLGVPAMGAIGVGYATSLVWTLLFIFLLAFTYFHKPYACLKIFTRISFPKPHLIKEFFSIGTPLALGLLMEVTMFGVIGVAIARFGVELTAAHQIAMNIASLAFMVPLGLSVAITARVGYWMGKKQYSQMKLAGFCGIGLSICFQALSVIIMLSLRYQLVSFYTDDEAIILTAASLLFLAAIFQFSDGLQVSAAGTLRGMKDTKIPMIYMGISYWAFGLPIGYYLAEKQQLLVEGYWIGIISGLTVAAILLLGRFINKSRDMLFK